jgi:capsular exopolysaccharide synthesis family protein
MVDKYDSQFRPTGIEKGVNEEFINLNQFIYIIKQYKWVILSFITVGGLLTGMFAYSLQPIYRSTATLLVGGDDPLMDSAQDYAGQSKRDRFFGGQYELIKSREVATAALARLGLEKFPWFDPYQQSNKFYFDWRDWIAASWLKSAAKETLPSEEKNLIWLRNNLKVTSVEDAPMFKVSFETHNPKMAALVANAVANSYIEKNLENRHNSTKVASEWLENQLEKSQQSINAAVDDLQRYRETTGLIDIDGKQSLNAEQLRILVNQLGEAQRVRAETYNLYRRAKQLRDVGQMYALPIVFNNPWIQQLKRERQELERQLRLDDDRYQVAYPGREEAEKTLETLNIQFESALSQILDGLKTDYELALNTETQLQARKGDLEIKIQELKRKEFHADALEQVVETNRQSRNAYMSQLMKTRTKHSDTVTMIARIVDPAIPDLIPVRPKKMSIIIIAVICAGFAGIGFAYVRESSIFHNNLRTREDVESKLGLPLLGEIILLPKKRENGSALVPATEFLNQPNSVFSESFRTIRAGVILSPHNKSTQVILVTSTVSGEGKSIVALNLAFALSQIGTVLLIDADLRRPSLASLCGLEPQSPGLVNLVDGTGKVAECITRIDGDIHLLSSGSTLPVDTIKTLASSRFVELLSTASKLYDSIVIDSSPVDMVSDVNMLLGHVSGVVYVIKADSTPYQAIRQGLKIFSTTGTNVIGGVLNQVNPKRARSYGKFKYGYYRSFDHYGQPSKGN